MVETLIVVALLAGATGYVGSRIVRSARALRRNQEGCGAGCGCDPGELPKQARS